jgi:peptidoglycan/xylan/chitin deacetylase (PgdA/CDA1 family)
MSVLAVLAPAGGLRADPPPTVSTDDAHTARIELSGAAEISGEQSGTTYVTFTFDDGPNQETTSAVLETLARYDIPATFFVVGQRFTGNGKLARANAGTLDRELAAGHQIGSHSFAHKNLRKQSPAQMRAAVERNSNAITAHLGYRPYLFRPPYGALNQRVRAFLREQGYTVAIWSIDPKDFRRGSPASLRAKVTRAIFKHGGGVVLMHDTKKRTAAALAGILDDLEAENCRRRASGTPLILPVSIHYFLRERNGTARPVPTRIAARTERYVAALAQRCELRAAPITSQTRSVTGSPIQGSGSK